MTLIGSIMDKVMQRGLYKAYVNDTMITMCRDCDHNHEEPNPITFIKLPVHRCIQSFELDGTHTPIIDPYSVPGFCPFKIEPEAMVK
jgi:hypothetical protein